jgi:hypothetical protein
MAKQTTFELRLERVLARIWRELRGTTLEETAERAMNRHDPKCTATIIESCQMAGIEVGPGGATANYLQTVDDLFWLQEQCDDRASRLVKRALKMFDSVEAKDALAEMDRKVRATQNTKRPELPILSRDAVFIQGWSGSFNRVSEPPDPSGAKVMKTDGDNTIFGFDIGPAYVWIGYRIGGPVALN